MENKLMENEQYFRALAENIPDVFWVASPDFERIIYVSPTYETIWGRSCESLYKQPKSWTDSIHPEDRERICDAFNKHIQGKTTFTEEYRIIRTGGTIRWIRDRAFSVSATSGVTEHVVGIAEDITERKQAEARLQDTLEQSRVWLDNSPVCTKVVDLDFNLKYMSAAGIQAL
jgi:PAS domain S-box-containing protein